MFFGWFRRVELRNDKYKYLPKSRSDFYLGNVMQVIFAYMQIGEIITDPIQIEEYSWHPHADKSRISNCTNALYIPRENLSFNDKLPGYDTIDYDIKRVLTKEGCTSAIWDELLFLMPDMVIGNRKNSAKEEGLYYQGQWQELVLKENKDAMECAAQIIAYAVLGWKGCVP